MAEYQAGGSLTGRTVSAFPISIGTSMALETVFSPRQAYYDPSRVLPPRVDIVEYQSCWINVATMIRNLTGAVDREVMRRSSHAEIADIITEEIGVIESLFNVEGKGVCKPYFYHSSYADLFKIKVPGVAFRHPTTPMQVAYQSMVNGVIRHLDRSSEILRHYNDTIRPPVKDSALILTHFPYDLVSEKSFTRMDLLESHTGTLKTKHAWNTKYNPMAGKGFSHLPFHRKLLMIFGDRYLIKPMPGKIREEILACSLKRKWTPLTTEDKMKLDVKLEILDPMNLQIFHTL